MLAGKSLSLYRCTRCGNVQTAKHPSTFCKDCQTASSFERIHTPADGLFAFTPVDPNTERVFRERIFRFRKEVDAYLSSEIKTELYRSRRQQQRQSDGGKKTQKKVEENNRDRDKKIRLLTAAMLNDGIPEKEIRRELAERFGLTPTRIGQIQRAESFP